MDCLFCNLVLEFHCTQPFGWAYYSAGKTNVHIKVQLSLARNITLHNQWTDLSSRERADERTNRWRPFALNCRPPPPPTRQSKCGSLLLGIGKPSAALKIGGQKRRGGSERVGSFAGTNSSSGSASIRTNEGGINDLMGHHERR